MCIAELELQSSGKRCCSRPRDKAKSREKNKITLFCQQSTRLCLKENFSLGTHVSKLVAPKKISGSLGSQNMAAGMPPPPSWSPEHIWLINYIICPSKSRIILYVHNDFTGLLITKLGNFNFRVQQKPVFCLMILIKVFMPFHYLKWEKWAMFRFLNQGEK